MKYKKQKAVVDPLKGIPKHKLVGNKPQNTLGRNIAVDLGSCSTKIVSKGVVLIDEPSVIAYDSFRKRVVAVGGKALEMYEKTPKNIEIIWPIRNGNVDDINLTVELLRGIFKMMNVKRPLFWKPNKMVISTPTRISKVEHWAIRKCGKKFGARRIKTIQSSIAVALGTGIDVNKPIGNLIVVIGGNTTDIAVISMGGILCGKTVNIGGETFNDEVIRFLNRYHNIAIGNRAAEDLKMAVGSVVSNLANAPKEYCISGRDLLTGLAKEVTINHSEFAQAIDHSFNNIVGYVSDTLNSLPPQIISDIAQNGILLAGGSTSLRGVACRIEAVTKCKVHILDNPAHAVVHGAFVALNNFKEFSFLKT